MVDKDVVGAVIPAVILAGGTNSAEMEAATGVKNRALVELAPGKTMLSFVIDAVKGSQLVSDLLVVGDVPSSPDYTSIATTTSFLGNLISGTKAAPESANKVLIVTSDIPFITSVAVDDFLKQALDSGADFCYPIIPMETYRKTFGSMKRTTLKTAKGEFTGGNIMLLSRSYVTDHSKTIDDAYAARKDILKLGGMLGWGLLLKVVLSQLIVPKILSVAALEAGVSHLLGHGATARAIVTEHASLGTDVDKPDDVKAAKVLLAAL